MLYKQNLNPKLTKELFEKPLSEYRGAPYFAVAYDIVQDAEGSLISAKRMPRDGKAEGQPWYGSATLETLATHAEQMGKPTAPASGRQEYLEGVLNNIIFG